GAALAPIDADMRGWLDLATADGLLRNVGRGRFVPSTAAGLDALDAPLALAADDFDGDGDVDLLAAVAAGGDDGATRLVRHDRVAGNARWLRVDLTGVRNPRVPIGAEIEVRAGQRYQKLPYRGVPLTFGVGDAAEVDTVRVTWPNGLIQNEPRQATGASYVYPEAQRLSGSCPMVYTWNGVEFTFITDVLGVAPLGVRTADGGTFPADHDETIQIAADQLVPDADGMLDVRITEELREIAYLDEIQLIAVDRPASLAVVTSDKFKAPPFPDFQLYGLDDPHKPIAARDHRGRDVRDAILRRDRTYPTGFTRTLTGLAEPHHLTLDFGPDAAPDGRALLVLHGWVDWADGSTFQASTQAGAPPQLPVLQAEDDDGRWVTIDADMGLPAGKPKTIAVAVDFPGRSRALRIVTNLCVYWDAIALEDDPRGTDAFRLTRLHATTARLGFGGFARVVVDPARLQPEVFVYADKRPTSMWNPARGLYTRYGDVGPLLNRIDDRFVIMGAGDELQLRFDARALPSLADGHVREWLLFVDGWAKDGDANTAHALTVEPLPYHGMPGYPYAAPDCYPDDPVRRLYREHYNVRPALRLIRPLTEGLVPAPAAAAAAAATEAER
ncbi:MAG: ASPIC/UnbV domain-containing protein, partial [Acidobacteriota bacterium]